MQPAVSSTTNQTQTTDIFNQSAVERSETCKSVVPQQITTVINLIKASQSQLNYLTHAEAFLKLGDYYFEQKEYLYAAAIYNYVRNIYCDKLENAEQEEQVIIHKLIKLENEFVSMLRTELQKEPIANNPQPYIKSNPQHRTYLQTLRRECKQRLAEIHQQYPFDIYHDEKTKGQEEQYHRLQLAKAAKIQQLYHAIAEQLKTFIRTLIQECIDSLGSPPCEYALIALGSLAREEATPYSDLEFAILIAEEQETYKQYFCNLTRLLQLKVLNLGETILPSLAIPLLNNFYSKDPSDNWFYDTITPRGFAFDGAMPQACKTPLGKKDSHGNTVYELIHTPHGFMQFQEEYWFKQEPHLPLILTNSSFIQGNQNLFNQYQDLIWGRLGKTQEIWKARTAILLKESLAQFEPKLYEQSEEGKLFMVKQEIYRLLSISMDILAPLYNLCGHPSTIQRIASLFKGVGQENLTIAASISLELRLQTYLTNHGQKEKLSAIASDLQKVFSIPSPDILFVYYYIALAFVANLRAFLADNSLSNVFFAKEFFDNSEKIKGQIFKRLLNYQRAKEQFLIWLNNEPNDMEVLDSLIGIMVYRGEYQKLEVKIEQYKKLLDSYQDNLQLKAAAYNNIGNYYRSIHNYDTAINYYNLALEIKQKHFKEDSIAHAVSYYSLGMVYIDQGNYKAGLDYLKQCLTIHKKVSHSKPDILLCKMAMGVGYLNLNAYDKAKKYLEQCLVMLKDSYGELHPDLALILTDLGNVNYRLGDGQQALILHSQALNLAKSYFEIPNATVACILDNLTNTHLEIGNYDDAKSYAEEALRQKQAVYQVPNPDVVRSYKNLIAVKRILNQMDEAKLDAEAMMKLITQMGEDRFTADDLADYYFELGKVHEGMSEEESAAAMSYYQKAQSCLDEYTKLNGIIHPKSLALYNYLGDFYLNLNKVERAEREYQAAIQLGSRIQTDDIQIQVALAHGNLGCLEFDRKAYGRAIENYENAIVILKALEQHSLNNESVLKMLAKYHFNLANAYFFNNDLENAIKNHNESLSRKISRYGNEVHPDLIGSFRCLSELHQRKSDVVTSAIFLIKALRIEGELFFNQGKLEAAIQKYLEVLLNKIALENLGLALPEELFPLLGDICHNLACVYFCQASNNSQRYQDAIQTFEASIIFNENSGIFCEYASFLYQTADYQKAIGYLLQSIKLNNDNKCLSYTEPEKPIVIDELKTAIDFHQVAIIKASILAYFLLIKCYLKLNQKPQAEETLVEFAKAVEAENDAFTFVFLGHACHELGQLGKAVKAYSKAIQYYQLTLNQGTYTLAEKYLQACQQSAVVSSQKVGEQQANAIELNALSDIAQTEVTLRATSDVGEQSSSRETSSTSQRLTLFKAVETSLFSNEQNIDDNNPDVKSTKGYEPS